MLGGPIAQLDSLTNTGSKAAGALHDAALAAKEFSDAQKKIDDAIQNSITAMKSQYTAIGQMIDLEKKEIAAKKELALAHLAADEASGTISSSEALRRRGAVTGQAAAATTALEIRAVETQRGEARAELSNAYYRQMATGVDVENQQKRIAGAESLEPARKQARDDESARIKAQHDLAVAEELAKPGFSMADPEVRQRAIRDLPELRRMAASTTAVAGISAGQAAAGEADFVGMQERLAELEKIKAKADHDVEQALLTLNPKIAAFTRELESLSKISALQEATEGIKAHTELRQSQNAQLKKSLEELNKVPDPTSSIDGLSDAVVEKMQTAVDGLNRMKLRLDQLDLRTANLR